MSDTTIDNAIRLPRGVRTLSTEGMLEVAAATQVSRHSRLKQMLAPILLAEAERRDEPSDIEPEWPTIDVSQWTAAELYWGAHECLVMTSIFNDPEARVLMRTVGVALLATLRHNCGGDAVLSRAGVFEAEGA